MILFELLSSLKLTLSPIQNRGKFEAAQLFKTDICSEDLVTVVICQNIRSNFNKCISTFNFLTQIVGKLHSYFSVCQNIFIQPSTYALEIK